MAKIAFWSFLVKKKCDIDPSRYGPLLIQNILQQLGVHFQSLDAYTKTIKSFYFYHFFLALCNMQLVLAVEYFDAEELRNKTKYNDEKYQSRFLCVTLRRNKVQNL